MATNLLRTTYEGHPIDVTSLYRYTVDELGNISVTKRNIDVCTNGHKARIRFDKGTSISIDAVNSVTNGRVVYLPVEDKKLAIDLIINNYENNIKLHKQMVEMYEDKLEAFKELNRKDS